MLEYKGVMISSRRIRSRGSDQKVSKLNRLKYGLDQVLIGQEPAHNRSDVEAGKKISKD